MILILFLSFAYATTVCTLKDLKIFQNQGTTFEARFRLFGGLWVGHDDFVTKVTEATGLSPMCASCYGDSYMCGKRNCWGSCAFSSGERCTDCLISSKCIENCKKCTGF